MSEVFDGSPAAKAGILPGDRVLSVNGRPVENFQQLLRRVSFLAPGSRAVLEIERGSERHRIDVALAQRPAQPARVLARAGLNDVLGLLLRDTTTDVQESLGYEPRSGALVAGVLPGSPAERAGIRAGDLITEANRRPVRSEQDFRRVVRADEGGGAVLVRFKRGDSVLYVAVDAR